jgi:hypothetical protein
VAFRVEVVAIGFGREKTSAIVLAIGVLLGLISFGVLGM